MNVDLKVVVFLLSLGATIFAVILGVSVGSGEYLVPSLVVALFVALFLVSQPQIAAFGAIATFSCGLTVPGLPGQMNLFDAFAAALIGICLLRATMRGRGKPLSRLEWLLLVYCGWILFIGAYRGFGFLAFGSDKIGGFNYVHLILGASLAMTLPRIGISEGMWKPAILLIGLLAPVTLIADILVAKGFAFGVIRLFIQTSSEVGSMIQDANYGGADALNRLLAAGPAATGMLLSLLCLVPARKFFNFTGLQWLVLYACIVVLSLLSGFRLMTASLFVISALALFFQKAFTAPRMIVLLSAGCAGLAFVYFYSSYLPNSVQRAISWLPGIHVSNSALGDATGTVDWRLNVWREAARYIPDYWLVGKGFSYRLHDVISSFYDPEGIDWALTVGSYHNGWLSMILCTGVIGTLLSIVLLVLPIIHHLRLQFAPWKNDQFKRYHGVFLASQITSVGTFFTIYGDVHASFPTIFFQWAVLETLAAYNQSLSTSVIASSEEVESVYQDA